MSATFKSISSFKNCYDFLLVLFQSVTEGSGRGYQSSEQVLRLYIMSRRNQQHQSESQSEAEEVKEEVGSNSEPLSQQEEGEDILEAPELDYQPIPELDQYEDQGVEEEVHAINPEQRKAAEKELELRDWNEVGLDDLDQLLGEEDEVDEELKKVRHEFYEADAGGSDDEQVDYIDPQLEVGPGSSWVATPSARGYIKRRLIKFLLNFRQKGKAIYYLALKDMCINNHQSIEIDYNHLKHDTIKLAEWIVRYPQEVLPEYSAALFSAAIKLYPSYEELFKECFFKIGNLPIIDNIRTLSYKHLGGLIKVRGVITSASCVFNQLRKVFFKCQRCGYIKGPFFPQDKTKIELGSCYSCHGPGPYKIASARSVYRNFQSLQLQESPSSVDPGRIPRSKEIIIFGDNIDRTKPGEQVQIIGVFTTRYDCGLNIKQGFPIFRTLIEVNNISHMDKIDFSNKLDEQEFFNIAKSSKFPQCFYHSIAPSIYGHISVKRAITLALFGGVQKKNQKKNHRIRGDLNVLLLGDPGIAKSQFLKSVQKVFPRSVYTTGKGASAVGLTASVSLDKFTKEWRLQAGALVIADKGVCLIDEFDKMTQQDRTSIHEAMEQQTISVSKAGIVATLNARCAVIAAANPSGGIYNDQVSFKDNVELSEPILSRFDLLCVLKDRPSEHIDGKLADFVIDQHRSNHPYRQQYSMQDDQMNEESKKLPVLLDQDLVKQYIKYARETFKPTITTKTSEIIKQVYMRLREFSITAGGINIVVRHLQSMIRVAEAHAKMHLRKETNEDDARVAVSTMLRSFIETQRHSTAQRIKAAFKFDLLPDEFPQKK